MRSPPTGSSSSTRIARGTARHFGRTAARGQQVGASWYITTQTTRVGGYCVPLSVFPGETVDFKMSARSVYTATYVRLKRQDNGSLGIPLTGPDHSGIDGLARYK